MITRALGVLHALEWSGYATCFNPYQDREPLRVACCPICRGVSPHDGTDAFEFGFPARLLGHREDCNLGSAINDLTSLVE